MRSTALRYLRLAALPLVLWAFDPASAQDAATSVLTSIEVSDDGPGQVVELRSDGVFERVGVQLFRDRGVIIQLPGMTPSAGIENLRPPAGLVTAIEVELADPADESTTLIIVRTREPVTQSVTSRNGMLTVRLVPQGAELPEPGPVVSPSPDDFEVTALREALDDSNRARVQLAGRLEGLSAEAEALTARAELLEKNRGVLTTDLTAARAQVAELEEQLEARTEAIAIAAQAASRREQELRDEIAGFEAQGVEVSERLRELEVRVEAAALERREADRALERTNAELAAARDRAAALEADSSSRAQEVASLEAELDRLEAELSEARAEAARQYQRARARSEADRLEQRVTGLTTQLERERAKASQEQQGLASQIEKLQRQLEGQRVAVENLERGAAEAAARADSELASTRQEAARLADALAQARAKGQQLEAALSRARNESERLGAAQSETNSEKERLAGALAEVGSENQQLEAELTRIRSEAEQLASALSDVRGENQQLSGALAEVRGERQRLEADLSQARNESERLGAAQSETSSEKERLASALAKTTSEKEQLEGELARTKSENEQLESGLAEAGGAKERLEASLASMRAEMKRNREASSERVLQAASDFENRLAELLRELDATRLELWRAQEANARQPADVPSEPVTEAWQSPKPADVLFAEDERPTPEAPVVEPLPNPELAGARDPEGQASSSSEPYPEPVTAEPEPTATDSEVLPIEAEAETKTDLEPEPEAAAEPAARSPEPLESAGALEEESPEVTAAWARRATRLRAEPTTNSEILAAIPQGTPLSLLGQRANWQAVRVEREGWVAADFLEPEDSTSGSSARTLDRINLRQEPGTEGAFIDTLPLDTAVEVLEPGEPWCRVRVTQQGWIYAPLITLDEAGELGQSDV